jgi:cardiolipin synthase A/B
MLIIATREARRPAQALTWLAISLVLPLIGFAGYLIASNHVRVLRERLTSPYNESDTLPNLFCRSVSSIAHGLRHFTVNGLRTGRVQVLTNGIETYGRLIESLQNAQRTIEVEYYIYRNDQIGSRVTDLLVEQAKYGVHVRFIRDGWASRKFPQSQIVRMTDAGIECRTVFPLRFPWILSTLNFRDHCKIVVIDGKEAFTGGINVGDEYLGCNPKIGFWRDTHLRLIGEVEADLQAIFDAHWKIASPERIMAKRPLNKKVDDTQRDPRRRSRNIPISSSIALSGLSAEWGAELGTRDATDTAPSTEALPEAYIQTLEGNPGIPTQVIRQAYFICITQAEKTVDITTPYFVPEVDIIMAIKTAVARGVRVRMLVPHRVAPGIVGFASRTYYGELVEAGVHIYLYDKGVLHTKVMSIDGEMSIVGAANYDMRSFRLDYEVCEAIYSADVVSELTEQFDRDLADSIPLCIEVLQKRSSLQRIQEQGARLLSSLL